MKKREMGIFTDRLQLICLWPIKRMVMMRKMRIVYDMALLGDNDEQGGDLVRPGTGDDGGDY